MKKSPDWHNQPISTGKTALSSQFSYSPTSQHAHTGGAGDGARINYNDLVNLPTKASSNIYGGWIASAGTANYLPTGWSVALSGTSTYTITHNLGNTNYVVNATALAYESPIDANYYAIDDNSFEIITYYLGSASASDFMFMLFVTG